MTIGEKIAQLRIEANISQEELAERLEVSRQSVSKWEMNQAIPQVDKILMICECFNISADIINSLMVKTGFFASGKCFAANFN